MYLHCTRCETTVYAARMISASPVCPRCGEPATEPLSFFSTMPERYRRLKPRRPPAAASRRLAVARDEQDGSEPLLH